MFLYLLPSFHALLCLAALFVIVLTLFLFFFCFFFCVFFFCFCFFFFFFFQAEDGIRDLLRSRGLGDVYIRQVCLSACLSLSVCLYVCLSVCLSVCLPVCLCGVCLYVCRSVWLSVCWILYTSDAADEDDSVDCSGGSRLSKKHVV